MFKVGDRVRAVNNWTCWFKEGDEFTVADVDNYIYIKHPKLGRGGFRAENFELVTNEFNVSTATDQELADEFRTTRKRLQELNDALVSRGFTVVSKGDNTRISKVLTTEL
jgi:hypothetical protein